ncbi:hypothetical protein [Nocardiopsis alba]|uniref:hypothetical protein n=1 Tax=Nocardiopsis alba TaxID=53437 RepID=UPI0003450727|nr:hypothetical protein [Nocardiopsis alba]
MTTPYTALSEMGRRPALYGRTTTAALWTDPHISGRMLAHHLDPDVEAASHGHGFVDRAVTWMRGRFDLGPGSRLLDLGCGPGLYTVHPRGPARGPGHGGGLLAVLGGVRRTRRAR